MTSTPAVPAMGTKDTGEDTTVQPPIARRVKQRLTSRGATIAAVIIAVIWTVPTLGLFISSFRPEENINQNGWWNVLSNFEFTLDNYADVLISGGSQSPNLGQYFINSLAIVSTAAVVVSVVVPLLRSAF